MPQRNSVAQALLRPAPMLGLEDAMVDPTSMTHDEISRRWRAIAHQVSSSDCLIQ